MDDREHVDTPDIQRRFGPLAAILLVPCLIGGIVGGVVALVVAFLLR